MFYSLSRSPTIIADSPAAERLFLLRTSGNRFLALRVCHCAISAPLGKGVMERLAPSPFSLRRTVVVAQKGLRHHCATKNGLVAQLMAASLRGPAGGPYVLSGRPDRRNPRDRGRHS